MKLYETLVGKHFWIQTDPKQRKLYNWDTLRRMLESTNIILTGIKPPDESKS